MEGMRMGMEVLRVTREASTLRGDALVGREPHSNINPPPHSKPSHCLIPRQNSMAVTMSVREAEHAGSWYSSNGPELARQLDHWLSLVPSSLPQPNARVVIAPHAGYAYSGPCAGWSYRCLDLSKAKRIFILHPSHHKYISTAALPSVTGYRTPLDKEPLPLDLQTIKTLSETEVKSENGKTIRFSSMSQSTDEAEHSAEMQLPYLHRLLQKQYPDQPVSSYPPLVPIMIGGTNPDTEKALGGVLARYIADPSNAFVLSSDFCHWGQRFSYTYYIPDAPSPAISAEKLPNSPSNPDEQSDLHNTISQGSQISRTPKSPKIHDSIAHVDRACMCAIATGSHDTFLSILQNTGNTVCGRHPIGVFMAGLEEVNRLRARQGVGTLEGKEVGSVGVSEGQRFRFVRYERSSDVVGVGDSSVSYVGGFAVLE
jgi:MEMO1 family protein